MENRYREVGISTALFVLTAAFLLFLLVPSVSAANLAHQKRPQEEAFLSQQIKGEIA